MIEIELQDKEIEKVAPIKSTAKAQPVKITFTSNEYKEIQEPTEYELESSEKEEQLVPSTTNTNNLKMGDVFYGTIRTKNSKAKSITKQGLFQVLSSKSTGKKNKSREYKVQDYTKNTFTVCSGAITLSSTIDKKEEQLKKRAKQLFDKKEKMLKEKEEEKKNEELKENLKKISYNFSKLEPKDKLLNLVKADINNIWMVGPAGCGKSTIAREVAKELEIPYLCISCGIGTSATEFIGYKYPNRESTKFAEYYAKKSIILIDEMTALDPSVAQVINAALANGEIETTTGTVKRHPECIIIATSNTFGGGADRQYVANNQLDASTIDRFIGGIIEVDYSEKYESRYDSEVVEYVNVLRTCIKNNSLRRIASTRMIQSAHKMKYTGILDWKDLLIVNWSNTEKMILSEEPYFKVPQKALKLKYRPTA